MNDPRRTADEVSQRESDLDRRLDAALANILAAEPALSADRSTHTWEVLLMTRMAALDPRRDSSQESIGKERAPMRVPLTRYVRQRWAVAVGAAVVIGAVVAGPAMAAQVDAFIHRAPRSAKEVELMEVVYQGQIYSWAQIYDLQHQGKAEYTVEDPTGYNKGQAHAFDTSAQVDAWECTTIPNLAKRSSCQSIESPTGQG